LDGGAAGAAVALGLLRGDLQDAQGNGELVHGLYMLLTDLSQVEALREHGFDSGISAYPRKGRCHFPCGTTRFSFLYDRRTSLRNRSSERSAIGT
jgi:hypothetical protein